MKLPFYGVGVDQPHLVCQIWAVRIGIKTVKLPFYGVGLDLPHLVSQTWSVRIGIKICEITILWGGDRSATPGESNMKCQNRNQICEIAVLQGVDLPHLVGQIWALRIGIKIHFMFGWPGVADLTQLHRMVISQFWFLFWQLKICEIAVLQG